MTEDDLIIAIKKRITRLQQQAEASIPFFSQDIESIICTKDLDKSRIEGLLDQLLNLSLLGVGEAQFQQLNRYYRDIDPEAAQFYQNEYREINK